MRKRNWKAPAAVAVSAALAFAGAPAATAAGRHPTPEQRATALVARMTLDEKITELHGVQNADHQRYVPGVDRLGIPPLAVTNGPAGVGPGDDPVQQPATALPAPISLAASFDTSLARQYGVVTGAETGDLGENVLEGPDVNIARVPVSGRTFEGYGEDPYLAGQLSVGNIKGIQSQGVIAEVKHYAANNQETNRGSVNEIIDDRTEHEIYLPQFEASVKQGGAGAVMCAYNRVNGPYNCENDHLLQNVLRGQWAFDGFVQSDFGAAHSTVASAEAGMDLEMPTGIYYDTAMRQAVQSGRISERSIDTLLVDRFATMIRLGLFDRPAGTSPVPIAADGAFARDAAEQGTVLLKNSAAQLPLDASALHSVAVIGPYAGAAKTGGGGSSQVKPEYTVDPVDGIRDRAGAAVSVGYDSGADPAAAAALAAKSDVAVVMVGDDETEGQDKPSMALSGNQDQLVEAVEAANPHTVVVVKSGAPVLMPWAAEVPAVVETWYPGEEDGNAVAAVLFGDVNPSGKLPVTFPRSAADVPAHTPEQYPGVNGTAVYSEGLDVGYRWYDSQGIAPLFPFGYGLSYTTFAFSHLKVTPVLTPDGQVTVGADVTNTGSRAGAEVAQVYLTDPASAGEPPRQLKGFAKVQLAAGQTRHVSFTLDQRAFSTWESAAQQWGTHDGRYTVSVGDSSRDLPLAAAVQVRSTFGAQGVDVSAPPVAAPGSTATVTTSFTNTGDLPVAQVSTALHPPAGWTSAATSPASFAVVAPRSTVRTTWHVRVPADAAPGSGTIDATASFGGPRHGTSAASAVLQVPHASLAAAYDNRGVTDDADPSAGAFVDSGKTYSAQALAAVGVRPGPVTYAGTSFTWPAAGNGQPDNVEANGQVVAFSGSGDLLAFLGAAASGTHGGTGTVYYTDGSSQPYSLSFSDWWTPAAGDQVVATAGYINAPTGRYEHTADLYYAAVPLQAGKTVQAVALPATGSSPSPGLHIFAMAAH
ncbi:glycoside hydrolase family 3 C-terminal domain-containing protein [Streptomyces sp. CA-111067]|uniref:glycoside hydrolase family 3 C-terminal domain-containing protein n=1 Tax=Streptomyces sp. CA-111067 TaxID=3240046 RepID=UPI003D952ADD